MKKKRRKTKSFHRKKDQARYLDRSTVKKAFETIIPRYKERNGGYTRIYKLGSRENDGAKMVIIELVK